MKRARFAAFLVLLAAPSAAFAWGPIGHRVVGRIAANHLTDEARVAVTCLIGPQGLDQVSTWADDLRNDPDWQPPGKNPSPWHYISIDDGETLETTARDPNGDVLEAIERFSAVLRDAQATRPAKQEALRFLVHFVGDVHQPLHVGRRADRGGNEIPLTLFKVATNLHSVWDNGLIDSEKLSFSELAAFLDHPTLIELQSWQASPPADWAKESKAVRERVYKIGDGNLSYPYAFDNLPLIRTRLLQAGVRLAGLLNSIFSQPGPSIPDRLAAVPPAAQYDEPPR
ncbi:MAG TPA: S1/P1 nuclease [Thermoanaerobaculia bacterium]|nr:S1/P1 nuclease [Thermoanaerobaculia bacterium]